jgi:CheY-like chemotaxis protein
MAKVTKKLFCPNCQMEVEAVLAPAAQGKGIVPRCTICGAVIVEGEAAAAEKSLSLDEVSFVDESISVPAMDRIIVVGYTPGIRELVVDKMSEKHLAREIIPAQNGEEMIINVINTLKSNGDGHIDLVVTDVPMPFLNGINAAIGLRALERTYPEHDLIPILFLTNKPCDDTFKKVIRFLAPAKYATLGPVDDKEKLIKHLYRILSLVAQEKW